MTDSPDTAAVVPATVAERARRLVDAVGGLDAGALPAAARRVAAAMPGSRSALAAEALARRWEAALAAWVADVGAHGAALLASARDYADADARSASAATALAEALP